MWVVPYNAELLLIWEGHCNVQYVMSQGLAAYITKYVTKGEPLSLVNMDATSRTLRHLLARCIGSMESIVLALGFDIFCSSSGVTYIPTSIPSMRNSTVRPPEIVEQDPDNPYYPDALEKYFAWLGTYEDYSYFQECQITKTCIRSEERRVGKECKSQLPSDC